MSDERERLYVMYSCGCGLKANVDPDVLTPEEYDAELARLRDHEDPRHSERFHDRIRKIVDEAPPLNEEQLDRLRAILRPVPPRRGPQNTQQG